MVLLARHTQPMLPAQSRRTPSGGERRAELAFAGDMHAMKCAMRRCLLVLLVLCAVLSTRGPAMAQSSDLPPPSAGGVVGEYQQTISQALDEYQFGHFAEARTLFAKAHALIPSARTLRGMGMAEFELRSYPQCIASLEEALNHPEKPLGGALRAETEALLSRARGFVAKVVVEVRPATRNIALFVDEAPVSWAQGRTLLLNVGEHVIEVRAEGYHPERRRLNVSGGQSETIRFSLSQEASRTPPPEPKRALYRNPWIWVGVGIVALGAGALGAGLALRNEPRDRTVPGDAAIGGGLVQTLRLTK